MYRNKLLLSLLMTLLFLAACGGNDETNEGDTPDAATNVTNNMADADKQTEEGEVDAHSASVDVPEGLKTAENPKYPVGSKAIVNASHMEGMEGAEATIVGAYDTTVYSISYTPTNGEQLEENHKWFVREEITPLDEETLDQGAEVIIDAEHVSGMKGAAGVIDTAEDTTVYLIDFTNSLDQTVTNYKWVKESELTESQ